MPAAAAFSGKKVFSVPGLEIIRLGFSIQEDRVVLAGEKPRGPAPGLVRPHDLVEEIFPAEHVVHEKPHLRAHAPVHMEEHHARVRQQLPGEG